MQIWVTKVLSAYCACLFANTSLLPVVFYVGFLNYYRRLHFNLQVITDSNRQLVRLLGKVQIFLCRKLALAILH